MKQSQIIENSQKICYPKEKIKAPNADICILKSHEKRKYTNTKNTYTGDILKRQEAIIMMTEDRYTTILDALKEKKSMTVAEFTEITGASESTIRRDLIALDDMGKIKRFHGGAKAIDGDRIILTTYAGREYKRYALIAGFTEIGESAEQTVRREVMEEVGISVKNITYYKSQPWGYDSNLLMGYFCQADIPEGGDGHLTIDRQELATGEWVNRDDIPDYPEHLSLTHEMMVYFKEHGQEVFK